MFTPTNRERMKSMTIITQIFLPILFLLFSHQIFGQLVENDFQTRLKLKLGFKPADNVKITLNPQLRLNESFQVTNYIADAEISYKPIKFLSIGGNYRLVGEVNGEGKTEILNRYALNSTLSTKLKRWQPSVRFKYTNYTEELNNGKFLRLRGKVEYNIRKSKITPSVYAEGYRELLEKDWYKMRYGLNLSYKFKKKQSVQVGYRLDYYLREYKNRHILNLGYKINF